LRSGDAEQAIAACVEALAQHPSDPNILCLAGRCLIALRRLDEARTYIEKARSSHSQFALGHETYGDLMLVEGRPEEAIKSYQTAAELDPQLPAIEAKIKRARELISQGQTPAPGRRKEMASAGEIARAEQLEKNGEPEKAEAIYRSILRRDPDHVEAMRLLAATATTHKQYRDAEVFLLQAVSRAPDYGRAWLDLIAAQLAQDKFPEAITSARRLVELVPDRADSYITLGNAQARADFGEEAIASYQAALDIAPTHPGAFAGLGQLLKTVGRQEEAVAAYRQNIDANPSIAEPYWSLANMKTFRFTDDEMANMEGLLAKDQLNDLGQVQLCNALGLGYERLRDFDSAFRYFERCNIRRRQSEAYDPVENEVYTDALIEVFSEQFLAEASGHGSANDAPIFIVGLPRSGSTLLEQILASHSQVEGTHELSDLSGVVRSIPRKNPPKDRFPGNLPGMKQEAWARIAGNYLQRTEKYRGGSPRFIDKNPNNFVYAGLLQLILPNARIINARRHPLDSCFGSYKQLFANGQPFSYDLTEIGEYYLQYQRLMDHWHTVMPGRVLDVEYENVVADLETQVRRILDYCGLPFEEACLNFHQTDRAVRTASSEQVRTPLYASSVDLWRNYEAHLGELVEVLSPLLAGRQ